MIPRCLIALLIMASTVSGMDLPEADLRMVDTLDRQARQLPTAARALQAYQEFRHTHSIPDDLQKRFNGRFETWKERADKDLVRLGTKWVTVEQRDTVAAEAKQMLLDAFQLLKVGDREGAGKKLQEASRHDPNGILSDFTMGLFNSGRILNVTVSHPESAIKHFRTVLKRSPGHVGAMNNLAVAYVKEGEVRRAVQLWKDAHEIEPDNSAVKHNLRRTLFESSRGTIEPRRGILAKLRDLVATDKDEPSLSEAGFAWAISPAIVPDTERIENSEVPADNSDSGDATEERRRKLIRVGSGTGFVVEQGYILTNRHVVEVDSYGTGDAFRISLPGVDDESYEATLVAVSDSDDLALLECPDFTAPPLSLNRSNPRRAQELMVIGYPRVDVLGKGVKTTVGIVTGLPAEDYQALLYDAITNPGSSGGPVVGRDGTVLAVHRAGTLTAKALGVGVPTTRVAAFVSGQVPTFTAVESGPAAEWADIAEVVSQSTVFVELFFAADNAAFVADHANSDQQDEDDVEYFLDRSCAHCKGWGKVGCPHPRCNGGGILNYKRWKEIRVSTELGTVARSRRKSFKTACPTCSGQNAVDCRFCRGSGLTR